MAHARRSYAYALLLFCTRWLFVVGMEFDMMYQSKCLTEEISKGVLVSGEYDAHEKDDRTRSVHVNVKVEDPDGIVLFEKKGSPEGQFTYTTKSSGDYKICFASENIATARKTRISLEWKTGVAATDWEAVAKKENLDAMALELVRLEETVKEVYDQMLQMKRREAEMRDLNEATNARVAWFGVFSLLVCITVAAWQLWYLKRFFQRKKVL